MKIAICDDDIITSGRIETIVRNCKDLTFIDTEVYLSGRELIRAFQNGIRYQLYLLDVMMPERDGFEVAKEIRLLDSSALIIFITSNHELIQNAFDVRAFHYLMKEETDFKIETVIRRAIAYVSDKQAFFSYKKSCKEYLIKNEDILYFESQKRKICIYTIHDIDDFYDTMNHVTNSLNPLYFTQIHKSYIVNLSHVKMLDNCQLILQNGISLPITANFRFDFNMKYRNFILHQMG